MAEVNDRRVRWYDPLSGRRRTRSFSTPQAARLFAQEREREAQLLRDGYLDPKELDRNARRNKRLSEAIDDIERDLVKRQVSDGHRKEMVRCMKAVITGCGFELVGDVGTEAIARYLERLIEAGKSARTHNFHRSAAAALCRWLVDYDYLDRNHARPIRTMNEQRDQRRASRPLSVAETEALLSAAPGRRLYYLFRVRTGLRGRECARLIWSDVDLPERTLKLRAQVTKNGRTDTLPIADDLAQALAKRQAELLQCGAAPGPQDAVFRTTPERRTWMRDIGLAKIKFLSTDGQADPKCLRKTYDSFLMHAGVDLTLVSLLMRHTPRGGLRLTLGVYGDERALLQRKQQAIAQMVSWYRQQKRRLKATG